MTDWLLTAPFGAILGFLIGLTGVGGSALVAPSLYVIVVLILAGAAATVVKAGQIAR